MSQMMNLDFDVKKNPTQSGISRNRPGFRGQNNQNLSRTSDLNPPRIGQHLEIETIGIRPKHQNSPKRTEI